MAVVRAARGTRGERGSMAVEVVILTPVLLAFVLLIVACSRYVAVKGEVEATARDAVRAASLERDAGAAQAAAYDVVSSSLDAELSCSGADLSGDFDAGQADPSRPAVHGVVRRARADRPSRVGGGQRHQLRAARHLPERRMSPRGPGRVGAPLPGHGPPVPAPSPGGPAAHRAGIVTRRGPRPPS